MCPCLRHLFAAHKFSCIPVELHPTTLCGMSLIIHANHTCFLHTARYFQAGVCVGGCFTTMDTVQKWTFKISYFRECKRHTTFSSAVCARNYMTAPHQRCGYKLHGKSATMNTSSANLQFHENPDLNSINTSCWQMASFHHSTLYRLEVGT